MGWDAEARDHDDNHGPHRQDHDSPAPTEPDLTENGPVKEGSGEVGTGDDTIPDRTNAQDSDAQDTDAASDLSRIVASAQRMGVELDEVEALQWLTAVALAQGSTDVVVDMGSGVFGHKVTMLDFSDRDLAWFRSIGDLVGLPDLPDVETALALSGSAAQSKVQTYPGDCDYFERVNIKAATREDACHRLGEVMRDKAMSAMETDTSQLVEVKFGTHTDDVVRDGRHEPAGSPISWAPPEIAAGRITATTPDGDPVILKWEDAALDPGWCKLDWVVADPVRRQVAGASNMLDVTWEAPDGSIVALDGYLDPYFQEVYLEADSVPLFSKLVDQLAGDALDGYVEALESEVHKYVAGPHPNYGKAAKRMYNIFRLNGSYEEAAWLRELFDEPTAVLYQVGAVVGTLAEAARHDTQMTRTTMLAALDELVLAVVRTLNGDAEYEIVRNLLKLRARITEGNTSTDGAAEDACVALAAIVNEFFLHRLQDLPTIAAYMDEITRVGPPTS